MKAKNRVIRIISAAAAGLLTSVCLLSCSQENHNYTPADSNGTGNASGEHVLYKMKNKGACPELKGKVHLEFALLDEGGSEWSVSDEESAKASIGQAVEGIEAEAARYSVPLEISVSYVRAKMGTTLPEAVAGTDWVEDAALAIDRYPLSESPAAMKAEFDVDSAAVVFAFNRAGRAYSVPSSGSGVEFSVIFTAEENSVAHEIYHLFGAVDLYYPEAVSTAAASLGNSVMNGGVHVDPATAYLLGWTQYPTVSASAFFEATKGLSASDMSSSDREEHVTGIRTKVFSSGTYTGALVFGVPSGKGRMEFTTGDVYDGEWKAGIQHGQGKMSWTSGDVYEGEWVENIREGNGRYTWANGNYYDGEWKAGERHGIGEMSTPSGVYSGQWVNGIKQGTGRFEYAGGAVYDGEWNDGIQHGQGKLTSPDGSVYEGEWQDGKMHGQGVYTSSAGSVYEGEYVDGEKHGQGKMTWASGDVYEGEWQGDVRSGTGTYTWANGDVYTGGWKDDMRSGEGTLSYKNGITLTGTWVNGEFDG